MNVAKASIAIVGAGPGGLAAAILLAHQGFSVDLFEKASVVGGRNAKLRVGEAAFDTGPTFFILPGILEEIFREVGKDLHAYVKIVKLDPMYRLVYDDRYIDVSTDRQKMRAELDRAFPGNSDNYDRFLRNEAKRFKKIFPLLQKKYTRVADLFDPRVFEAIPQAALGKTLIDVLKQYFVDERLQVAFSFQAKYLGMSPWKCPGLFGILPYIEHQYGVYHVIGGLNELSIAMAKVAEELGVNIHLNSPVERVLVEDKVATGVRVAGKDMLYDRVVINADFTYAMQNMFDEGVIKKWNAQAVEKKSYSCSIYIMYLELDTVYDLPHNTIIFSRDYKEYVDNITATGPLQDDVSIYVCNTAASDQTMAPKGKSGLYILVPVSNNRADIDWNIESPRLREVVLRILEQRAGLDDVRSHIMSEKITTPADWESRYNVYIGAVFNLGHQMNQMLYWRPRNKFEEVDHCYLVGGGTHPGSGLPTIYESARISAHLIAEEFGEDYQEGDSLLVLK